MFYICINLNISINILWIYFIERCVHKVSMMCSGTGKQAIDYLSYWGTYVQWGAR